MYEWICLDCGANGQVENTADVWRVISEANYQHGAQSPDCELKRARIFPKEYETRKIKNYAGSDTKN